MYSNFNFQFLEKSSVFLSYHNGNINSSGYPLLYPFYKTALGAVSPI